MGSTELSPQQLADEADIDPRLSAAIVWQALEQAVAPFCPEREKKNINKEKNKKKKQILFKPDRGR